MSRDVPLSRPSITDDEAANVAEVILSGWLTHGDFNRRFEGEFAELIGVQNAISMNSCPSALEAALQVAGIQGEVIIPSMTWVATANAVVTSGATPVFCDVDVATRNMTASLIEERITPDTEAVIVVHFGGQPCQMDSIAELCKRRGMLLIEDSAETLGATWRGRQAGSFGVGCYSFFPTKNITTGEGGMLTCEDDEFAERVRAFIGHGITRTTADRDSARKPWLREASMPGHNFRMPNPLAALGLSQLERLDSMNHRRVELAGRYVSLLSELAPGLGLPTVAQGATHVYQMFTVTAPANLRDGIVEYLRDRGIGASVHFDPPVHSQPYYRSILSEPPALPATEELASTLITLPIFPDMKDQEQDWVVEALVSAFAMPGSDESPA